MTSRSDTEAELRALWTAKGVSPERQDELVAQIAGTPAPVFFDAPFCEAVERAVQTDPDYHQGFFDAQAGEPLHADAFLIYAMGWNAYWKAREVLDTPFYRPAEDLTPEGIQLVIPGAERIQPPSVKQGELF